MDNKKICQSCGRVMDAEDLFGTNEDESMNEEYCIYCYENGEFVDDCTMEEMIDGCIEDMMETGMLEEQNKTVDEARELMLSSFSGLKRWKNG